MSMKYDVAIVGATGIVGEVFLEVLREREFPIDNLYVIASEKSSGELLSFGEKNLKVQAIDNFDFEKVHYAFFSAGAKVSALHAQRAADAGCVVIDNSSQFRYDPEIPLVVPEVNPQALENYQERNIIANPNCSTIQLVVALKPLYDAVGITRVNVATYQAVSGAGREAIEELARQTADLLNGQESPVDALPTQIAFNVIPHIDSFQENGYTREEMKLYWETQKILGDPDIQVNATAVRVPVFYGHSEAVNIETVQPIDVEQACDLLRHAPSIELYDTGLYPTPVTDAANQDKVFVGRVRQDISHPNGLNMWLVADNVRKGAALNAVQIAELLIQDSFYLQ
jgi:aspartate-semialdehyde dehydrogenase